jgi:hypothetical protein
MHRTCPNLQKSYQCKLLQKRLAYVLSVYCSPYKRKLMLFHVFLLWSKVTNQIHKTFSTVFFMWKKSVTATQFSSNKRRGHVRMKCNSTIKLLETFKFFHLLLPVQQLTLN